MQAIGWIGLGKMGEPMARHLRMAGHGLKVWNRTAAKADRLVAAGAAPAASPADAARGSSVVFAMLADDTALRGALLGPSGAVAAMAPGAVLVEMSTVSPAVSAELAEACAAQGVSYLCAPVSGSVAFAEDAKLTVLASGSVEVYAATVPLMRAFSAKQVHVGQGGEARVMKLALNMMVGLTAAMMGEALALGEKNGLSREVMLDVIGASAVASPLVAYKLGMLRARDYAPAFEARMMAKDFDLALGVAHGSGVPIPMTAQVREGFSAMIARGDGDADFFNYVELTARLAGLDGG
ncbi:MAG: dehydrogenase [Xanthobacteraceae bacterium]|nr:MAG: dehydrogenase [Xanthobacteraceae bacterium]